MSGIVSDALEWAAVRIHRLRVHRQFHSCMGYYGDFENPRSHQEKVQFRKIYGNHPFYARLADKYRVRDYVAARVGQKYLVPLLGVYDRLERKHFDALPNRFIIKANHGCKWHQIVGDKRTLDIDATIQRFNKYMRMQYGWSSGERHYGLIKPRIVIEELLEADTGGSPWDYCFFCYNGSSGFDYAYSIVSPKGKAASFAKTGELLDSQLSERELAPHLNPANFARMVQVARVLSADFDFVRVDLYNVRGRIYFGELTCTPQQGYGKIGEPRRQRMRDEMWELDAHNRLLYRAPRAYGRRSTPIQQPIPAVNPATPAIERTG